MLLCLEHMDICCVFQGGGRNRLNSGYDNDCGVFGSYFSHPCDQTPDKRIFRKEGLVLADSLRGTVQHSEKDGGRRQT